jgi:hypothetical protein
VLFSEYLPENDAVEALRSGRRKLLDLILADFRTAFPNLSFELRLDRKIINAQATKLKGKCCVLIYGGLALHPKLGADSLTFAVLHETGHHLAEGNRSPYNVCLACECASDHWAATKGAISLHERSGRRFQIRQATDELHHIMKGQQQLGSQASINRRGCDCWNVAWSVRQSALLMHFDPPSSPKCLMEFATS